MGAGHSHTGTEARVDTSVAKRLTILVIVAALATVALTASLWPSGPVPGDDGFSATRYDSEISRIEECAEEDQIAGTEIRCDVLLVELLEGPDQGQLFALPPIYDQRAGFDVGEKLSVEAIDQEGAPFDYVFSDRLRQQTLLILAVAFALSVIILGRFRGVMALAGLAFSVAVLAMFTLPALLRGESALPVACATAALITFAALYLAHGFTTTTTAAVLGTLGALAITIGLGELFINLARFSGFSSEEAYFVEAAAGSVDIRGLLLAGLVIGALGALDDMTVTQSSVVFELRAANPSMTRRELFASAMRVGRDHVASTVNTLFLAYAGASLPLMLLFAVGEFPAADVANSEIVATEIVRTLVGSIGLVVSVPLTTWLAVIALRTSESTGTSVGEAPTDTPEGRPTVRRSEPEQRPGFFERLRAELDE